jgi:hypothetical protein
MGSVPTFATQEDLEKYQAAKAAGLSEEQALAVKRQVLVRVIAP